MKLVIIYAPEERDVAAAFFAHLRSLRDLAITTQSFCTTDPALADHLPSADIVLPLLSIPLVTWWVTSGPSCATSPSWCDRARIVPVLVRTCIWRTVFAGAAFGNLALPRSGKWIAEGDADALMAECVGELRAIVAGLRSERLARRASR